MHVCVQGCRVGTGKAEEGKIRQDRERQGRQGKARQGRAGQVRGGVIEGGGGAPWPAVVCEERVASRG